jgi:hypothetical protein
MTCKHQINVWTKCGVFMYGNGETDKSLKLVINLTKSIDHENKINVI